MILSYTLILPTSQLQTQQPTASQIRSHIEYLTQTYNILVLILYSKLMRNVAALAVFNTIYWRFLMIVAYFFGPPCTEATQTVASSRGGHIHTTCRDVVS